MNNEREITMCLGRQAATACLVALAIVVSSAPAADWPQFTGDGDRTPPKEGVTLVNHLGSAPVLWELEHHMGVGKGLYPGTLKLCKELGIEPFYAGAASPVVANGLVYVSYYKPNGKVKAKIKPWRTVSDPASLLPEKFFSVAADDLLVAVDAETGQIRWEAVEKDKGHNRLGHKRGHWCVAPAVADGRVFSMGTAGWLYAYDAKSGKKLWETVAEPALQEQLREYLQSQELCWQASEKSSLAVVDDLVLVPMGNLAAFDAKTGQPRWKTDQRNGLLSNWSTPVIYREGDKAYILANTSQGDLRLIDAANGKIVWEEHGLGEQLGTVNLSGDLAVLNARSKMSDDEKANGLFGVCQVSSKGLRQLWTLPDREEYRHSWTMDRGAERRASIQDGVVYFVVGLNKTDRLVVADATTGKIYAEQEIGRGHSPYVIEDRILLFIDRAHTDPIVASWWSIPADPRKGPTELHGARAFGPRTITGYEVPMEWPYADGRLYLRTLRGLACIDLRQPADTTDNRTLRMNVPAKFLRGEAFTIEINQRDGKLIDGFVRESRRLGSVDVARLKWDGKRLTGEFGVSGEGFKRPATVSVDATADEDGALVGKLIRVSEPLKEPVHLSGKIDAIERQDYWMPQCTHVLRLNDAAFQTGGDVGYLFLFLTAVDGNLVDVTGFANRITKATPLVDARGLDLSDGRVSGTVWVEYRADEWTRPLAAPGEYAVAAVYRIDSALQPKDGAGSFSGQFGVRWERKAAIQ